MITRDDGQMVETITLALLTPKKFLAEIEDKYPVIHDMLSTKARIENDIFFFDSENIEIEMPEGITLTKEHLWVGEIADNVLRFKYHQEGSVSSVAISKAVFFSDNAIIIGHNHPSFGGEIAKKIYPLPSHQDIVTAKHLAETINILRDINKGTTQPLEVISVVWGGDEKKLRGHFFFVSDHATKVCHAYAAKACFCFSNK